MSWPEAAVMIALVFGAFGGLSFCIWAIMRGPRR